MGRRKIFNSNYSDFFNIPYEDRKFILIIKDKVFNQLLDKMNLNNNSKIIDIETESIHIEKLRLAKGLKKTFTIFSVYEKLYFLFRFGFNTLYKLIKENIGINFMFVNENVSKNLNFPYGHPKERILYAGHPHEANTYFTLAEFHRDIIDSKFYEIHKILRCLGAVEIKLFCSEGFDVELNRKGGLGIPRTGSFPSIDIEGKFKKTSERNYIFQTSEKFQIHDKKPHLPDNLIWYNYEKKWQHIVEQRLQNGLFDINLEFESNDNFGIEKELILKVEKAGLKLGGSFKEFKKTKWMISSKFK